MSRFPGRNRSVWSLAAAFLTLVPSLPAAQTVWSSQGLSVSVDESGSYDIQVPNPAWGFGGSLGTRLSNIATVHGTDLADSYSEITFDFQTDAPRHAAIRVYDHRNAVLFTLECPSGAPNTVAFPTLSRFPAGLSHFAYGGMFASPTFSSLPGESPWIFFDGGANSFILSAAAHFMVAQNSRGANGEIAAGIAPAIPSLPPGFSHRVLLVADTGINRAFDTWGKLLTDLSGKVRPPNDADVSLNQLGYWTDNGAAYYYHANGPTAAYEPTLSAVKHSFDSMGIGLGSIQLDSWFYPKGPNFDWLDSADGMNEYVAAPSLFGSGLASFQQSLGIPLITHARWIDASSPYRQRYQISGNVAIDPQYWRDVASYLKQSGVSVYEQDWLGAQAHADFNLSDPEAFLDRMAAAMSQQNIDMQYCMATPRHFLQGSKYSNLTSIRTSGDRLEPGRWTAFLYSSRLAGALGIWPFTDVFMSPETGNLLLATLSAGPIGIGDPLGSTNAANLLHAVRADGVIVKPDAPLLPLDSSFRNDSQPAGLPMIAGTYSDFGGLRTHYIFAYPQNGNAEARFRLSETGASGPFYVFDSFAGTGRIVDAGDEITASIANGFLYLTAAPVGRSGMAVLGDAGQFVGMGKKRIAALTDDGTIRVTVTFAAGEGARIIEGYSPDSPRTAAEHGTASRIAYDPATHRFRLAVTPGPDGTATVVLARVPRGRLIRR